MQRKRIRKLTPLGILTAVLLAVLVCGIGLSTIRRTKNEPPVGTSADPSITPVLVPTPEATEEPTPEPTEEPTPEATEEPTPEPTKKPAEKTATTYYFHADHEKKDYAPRESDKRTYFTTGFYGMTTDGTAYTDFSYDEIDIGVENPGSSLYSVRVSREGIPVKAGKQGSVSFILSSDIPVNISVQLVSQANGSVIAEQGFRAGTDGTFCTMPFRSGASVSCAIMINAGNDGSQDVRNYHTVKVRDLHIETEDPYYGVSVDQVGYVSSMQKICSFPYDAGDLFYVINEHNEPVFTGAIVSKSHDPHAGEDNCYGEFTEITEPGTYTVRTQIGTVSQPFTISEDPYGQLRDAAIRMLSMQRCSEQLDDWWAGGMAHGVCHNYDAIIYDTVNYKSVTGGWHDAGDYGKYMETGSKAVNDLLFTYLASPDLWTDSIGFPQSGNGIPDILDEAKYELDWMLKMQNDDGGVINTVIPRNISEIVLPEHDNQELILLYPETTSTADFAGTMAVASIVYEHIDRNFSRQCLNAAKKADYWLSQNPKHIDLSNPEGVNGGVYRDASDTDGRFFAKTALWAATFDTSYLEEAKKLYASDPACANGLSWRDNGGYGRYIFLSAKDADRIDAGFYKDMRASLIKEADSIMERLAYGNGYLCSLYTYGWGSNGDALNNGIVLSMAYDLTGNQKFQQAAGEQVHYVLGRNSLNVCFVTGFGSNYPKDVHSRIAKANKTSLPGALVGGPDSYREDKYTQALPADTPEAKAYVDTFDSWSTNEVTVYYNSALIHMLGRLH